MSIQHTAPGSNPRSFEHESSLITTKKQCYLSKSMHQNFQLHLSMAHSCCVSYGRFPPKCFITFATDLIYDDRSQILFEASGERESQKTNPAVFNL